MKFKITTKVFRDILHPIAHDIAARNGNGDAVAIRLFPNLNGILVRASSPAAHVSALVPVKDIADADTGSFAVPGTPLDEYLAQSVVEELDIEVHDGIFHVHAGNACARFPVFEDEIPEERPVGEGPAKIVLPAKAFQDCLAALLPAMASDAVRPQLQSVHVETREGVADIVCTDARIMGVEHIAALEGSDDGVTANIPGESAAFIARVCPKNDENVTVEVGRDGANARVRAGHYDIVFPLVREKYPDYRSILGSEGPVSATVGVAALKLGLNLAQATDITTGIVKLDFRANLAGADLTVTSEELFGTTKVKTTSTFGCDYAGDDMAVTFPRKRLVEALRIADGDDVQFRLRSPRHAAFVVNAHREENDPDRLVMLMPMAKK